MEVRVVRGNEEWSESRVVRGRVCESESEQRVGVAVESTER